MDPMNEAVQIEEGEKSDALKGFIDALAPEIRALGPSMVGAVDDGVRALLHALAQPYGGPGTPFPPMPDPPEGFVIHEAPFRFPG